MPSLPIAPDPSAPARDARPGLSGLTAGELATWFAERGEPSYRARQVGDAVWGRTASSVEDIRTLPAALREAVEAAFRFDTVGDTELRLSDGDLTEKALHRLSDGTNVE